MASSLNERLLEPSGEGETTPRRRRVNRLRIFVDDTKYVDVCLLDGADSQSLSACVEAALQHAIPTGDTWYLVDGEDDMVVPLCSALPDGTCLALRTSSGRLGAKTATFSSATDVVDAPSLRRSLREFMGGETRVLSNVERWSRLSTELANERTLLAWVRTALAAERTVFTFLGFKATGDIWQHLYFSTTALLATVSIIFGVIGVERFYKLKKAILLAEPPSMYARLTIQPTLLAFGIILTVAAVATYSHVLAKV